MQMEWVGRSVLSRNGDLDNLVCGKRHDTRNKLLSSERSAEDLEEDRESGRLIWCAIDEEEEVNEVNADNKVDPDVSTVRVRGAGCTGVDKGVEVGFEERRKGCYIGASWIGDGGVAVAEDGGVDAASEALVTKAWVCADPRRKV